MHSIRKQPVTWTASIAVFFVFLTNLAAPGADHPSDRSATKVTSVIQLTHDGVTKTGLLSDDSNLYITELPTGQHVVAKFSLKTSDQSLISSSLANIRALDISPDGTRLLVSPINGGISGIELWTVPLSAGAASKLGDGFGRDASWSPDGKQLVFGKGSALYVTNNDGSGEHKVFAAEGSVFAPHFAPDGKRIRFNVGNGGQNVTTIWEVGIDGANPRPVLPGWQYASAACCGNWTADGRYYIFQVTQAVPTPVTTLWAIPDTTEKDDATPIELTRGPMSFGNASPARDNKGIWAIGVQPSAEAVQYDPSKKDFVSLLSGVSATDLDFSSDGKWVSYVSVPDGILWRCRADGSDRLQLTSSPERVALPRWSPDGKQIAYVSMHPGKPSKIAIISAQGGAPVDLLKENRSQIDANWSPDGTQIMFGYLHAAEKIDIRVVNLKTHAVKIVPGSQGLFSPRWSPNGRYIAAMSPDFTKVMLFDYRTRKWSNWLTEPAGAVSYPVWSSDNAYLYFDDLVTDEESIRRVKVGQNHTEHVFTLNGIERYPGPFGLWSGRTPNGVWMFARDRSTQEVYQLSVALP
jgi:Tol biopolymer transport system component